MLSRASDTSFIHTLLQKLIRASKAGEFLLGWIFALVLSYELTKRRVSGILLKTLLERTNPEIIQ